MWLPVLSLPPSVYISIDLTMSVLPLSHPCFPFTNLQMLPSSSLFSALEKTCWTLSQNLYFSSCCYVLYSRVNTAVTANHITRVVPSRLWNSWRFGSGSWVGWTTMSVGAMMPTGITLRTPALHCTELKPSMKINFKNQCFMRLT